MYSALTGLKEEEKQNFIQEAATLLKEHLGIVDQIFNSEKGGAQVGQAVVQKPGDPELERL